jgi:hypothetical protein
MKIIEDGCVGCPPEIGCLGSACRYKNEIHFYCDKCLNETTLFFFGDSELCADCVLEQLDVVKGSE